MSEFKEWERETIVGVPDVERWDLSKSQVRDIVWDAGSKYQEETLELIGEKGRNGSTITFYASNQYTTQINPANWVAFPTAAYTAMATNAGYQMTSNNHPEGTCIGIKIDLRSLANSVSTNILAGLTDEDDIKKRLVALSFTLKGEGTGIAIPVQSSNTYWSGALNNSTGAWVRFQPANTADGYQLQPWDMFLELVKFGLGDYMDANYCVWMYYYPGYGSTLKNIRISISYMLSLNHLWMPRNESYTRDQISGELVRLISGKSFWTDKKPENFTKAENSKGTAPYDGWDLAKCPHVVYCDFYNNSYGTNALPTTLSGLLAGLYPVPAYYLSYTQVLKQGNMFFMPPKQRYTVADGWHLEEDYCKPIVFKFDLVAGMKKEYPDLFPNGQTREQYANIIRTLNNKFVFTTTMGRNAFNNGTGTTPSDGTRYQVPPINVRSYLWRASTSSNVQQRSYTVPESKNTIDSNTGLAIGESAGDPITMSLGFTLTDVKSYITDDGYLYWYVIGNGWLSNTPSNLGVVSNVRRAQSGVVQLKKANDDRAPHFVEDYQVSIKMPDVYERVTSHEADIASLQAQIDELKNK